MKKTILLLTLLLTIGIGTSIFLSNNSKLPLMSEPLLANLEVLTKSESPSLDCNYVSVPKEDCKISATFEAKAKAFKWTVVTVDGSVDLAVTGIHECRYVTENGETCEPFTCQYVHDKLMDKF